MTIRIKLIPDGIGSLPAEARDHSILASHLESADPPDHTPAPSWGDIERVLVGDELYLQIEGATLDDYASGALDAYATAVTNISGLKKHPDGWEAVDESV